ncbi:UNVERIFIED_CONTAM: hypothetical protein K2H54_041396 [Gekko kuhli]
MASCRQHNHQLPHKNANKSRSMEKMAFFSATKWTTHNREPVMVHDILSNDIAEFGDNKRLEITAMIHSVKDDNRDLLHSTSELCLEDDTDLGDLGLQVYLEGRKVYGTLPSNEMEGGQTVKKPVGGGYKKKALEETKGKSEPSGEARGGEQ